MSRSFVIGILLVLCVLAAGAGCTGQPAKTVVTPAVTIAPPTGAEQQGFTAIPQAPLNATETADILYLQEAEKLQHDLNAQLFTMHTDLPVFRQIANATAVAMAADDVILVRYNLTDPESATPGVFNNPTLQRMYTTGYNNGRNSAADALNSSAAITDMHIADLTGAMSRTDNADLQYLYRQQAALSRNNLRVLSQWLAAYGITYTPTYITPAAYTQIVSTPPEQLPVP